MERQNNLNGDVLRQYPSAALAWEFLRRNPTYRQDYHALVVKRMDRFPLSIGGEMTRTRRRYPGAEKWGLCVFEDPDISANRAQIFWRPDVMSETLSVQMHQRANPNALPDGLVLDNLRVRKSFLEMPGYPRQVRLFGEGLWIQLRTRSELAFNASSRMEIRLRRVDTAEFRLRTAQDLLTVFSADNRSKLPSDPPANSRNLLRYLQAYDVRKKGGSYRDIAIALEGVDQVERDWNVSTRYLKDRARRAFLRGRAFVNGEYLTLLS